MPELPEVESARRIVESAGLRRRIVTVDDTDTFVCRPHVPGDIASALLGRELIAARRIGKSMWCETSDGPPLGLHLGMSGKIVIATPDGTEIDGGDYWDRGRQAGDHRFSRFALGFADGGALILVDPRRLGRVRLDPDIAALGPDAASVTSAQFHALLSRSIAPVKARLLDQSAIAGIGNLLADQILWAAKVHPRRPVLSLTHAEVTRLLRATRRSIGDAIRDGGVHTLRVVPHRKPGGACPRDHAPMLRATVGGRTTWWCEAEQVEA